MSRAGEGVGDLLLSEEKGTVVRSPKYHEGRNVCLAMNPLVYACVGSECL